MALSILIVLILCYFFHLVLPSLYKWISCPVSSCGRGNNELTKARPLPPGTVGWPYIGETLQLYSQNPNVFFFQKQKKYGSIFKTHILGCRCVVLTRPEAVRFVLTQSRFFKPTFPASKMRMLGREALFFHQGEYHSKLRKLVIRALLPESLKKSVAAINSIAEKVLKSCDGQSVTAFHEMKTYAFNVALLMIFGDGDSFDREELKRLYYVLEKGYNSLPINLPGTLFHSAMKSRKQLSLIMKTILSDRRQSSGNFHDLLSSFMSEEAALSDTQISDNIIGMVFAARDTTASVLTWILKYLADSPSVLQAVTEEQERVRNAREHRNGDKSLSWSDTRNMPLTSRVILETMRGASVLSFTFREAMEDVEFEGYLIPKGWKVLPLFRNIHHNPDIFPDPEKFDPSRFEVTPKAHTFLPFGNGIHSCPGNELAKLEMLVFVHHITTQYRWTLLGSQSGIQYGPFALPQNGLPIHLSHKDTASIIVANQQN